MEIKKIVEGMTAPQVAQVIDDNFKAQNEILEEDIAKQNNVIGVSEYKDFSEAEAVSVGDVRKYNGLLYECVEATTGAFDASKWKKSSFKAETEKKLSELGQYVENNPEYARAYTDAEGRFLWGIKQDGSIEWAKGVPQPIKDYIALVDLENDEEVERINQLVIGLLADVKVLTDTYHYISNPEWACAIVDAEERILMGIKTDGSYYIPNRDLYHVESNPEYTKVVVDSEGRVLFGIKTDGSCYIPKGISEGAKKGLLELTSQIAYFEDMFSSVNNPEWIQVTTDSDGKILEGIGNDGKKYFPKQELFEKYKDAEGRIEMTLDVDGKIISYRDSDGLKHETKMSIKDKLSLGIGAMSDLQKALRESGFNVDNPIDWSNEKAITLPIPRYCAKVNIIVEGGLATTKTQNKKGILQYWDKSGNYFKKYIIDNAQGSSSMSYIEKNQGIDVFNDEACEESCDIIFGNWVAQDSFHLKCYYIDVFRGIANVGYNFCEEVIQFMGCRNNRVKFDNSTITKDNSTGDFDVDFGDGALCHPDGFPFEMYVNGEYYGLFAWNLKKHRKNYSMNKKDYTSTLLDGVIDGTTFFNGSIDWTQFELRNPKDLVTMDGREYDADTNCNELIDETSSYYDSSNSVHVNTAKIKKLIERQSTAIPLIKSETDIEAARSLFEQYYDVDAMMCYLIVSNVIYNEDGFRKNWIWTIYDKIAAPSFYDLDSILGRYWDGTKVVENSITNILGVGGNNPTAQLKRLYSSEINTVYKDLRNSNIISVSNIMKYVHDWIKKVGLVEYKKNIDKWSNIPSYRAERTENDGSYSDGGMFDSPKRIELWLIDRIAYLDDYFKYNV